MKVLLLKDVPDVGRKNEVKEVNDGFARNFLLLKKLAVPATSDKVKAVETEKTNKKHKQASDIKKFQDIADKLKSVEVVIVTKVGEKGKAFGSIGSHQIKKALDVKGINIEEGWISLEEPIKTTGSKTIDITFPQGVVGSFTVIIKPE
ncbi:MAG: 50S ribosomal protein L9 [bacterium]|nr:50S ribosomal protein L9 [bacterium]MDZ4260064.1 50S ribosomal protein L9 [Candidatus Sungbacteria bacterium]